MKINHRFLAGLFVLATVVLGINQAQAVPQTLTFNATADNAYAIYTGTGTSATQMVGSALNFSTAGQIFAPESYTTTAQDTDWIYIAAWSDDSSWQGFLADFTNTTIGATVLSGDSRWEVASTGINLGEGSATPTLANITTQIGLANGSGGWKPITASALTNSQGGIHNVVVTGIAGGARWMWWNNGNQGGATAPFSPGFNHSEYLIFRLAVTAGTPPPPDIVLPTILSTNPSNAATSVAINSPIAAVFSEPMNPSTVTSATFTLSGGITGTVTYSGTTATFTPSTNLAANTTYTATITTGVTDVSGNALAANYVWTFTTTPPDTTPPTVTSTNPANAATSVFLDSNIVANFSEQLLASTVTTTTFTLSGGITGTVTYSGTKATFNPNSDLAANTTNTATITTGVTDVSGNALAATYAWTFTTGTSVTPVTGDVDIPTLPEWAAIIMALLLMGLAIKAQARSRA